MSVTRGGTPGENAHMESFFHSLKADVIHGRVQAVDALRQQLRRYVRYYNYRLLHSSLGYQSPVDYETSCRVELHVSTEPREDPAPLGCESARLICGVRPIEISKWTRRSSRLSTSGAGASN